MTVVLVTQTKHYVGVAADTKPTTGVPAGSRFFETDTGDAYVYGGASWTVVPTARLDSGTNVIGKVGIDPALMAAADVHAPAANTAAVVTYAAAGAGISHVIAGVAWSYNAAPTGGNLKIEDVSGTTILTLDITAAGPGFIPFPVPLKGDANAALIVTLAAGGASATGKVSVLGHWTV